MLIMNSYQPKGFREVEMNKLYSNATLALQDVVQNAVFKNDGHIESAGRFGRDDAVRGIEYFISDFGAFFVFFVSFF